MQQYIIHSPSTIMTRFAIAAINSKIKDRISKVMSQGAPGQWSLLTTMCRSNCN